MMKIKLGTFVIIMTSFLLEQQDHKKFGYASLNRKSTKWSCCDHKGASKLGPLNFVVKLSFNQTTMIGLRYP